MDSTKEILEFLSTWRTRAQLEKKFELSNTQSFRILRWLKKGNFISETKMTIEGHQNRCFFYKVK